MCFWSWCDPRCRFDRWPSVVACVLVVERCYFPWTVVAVQKGTRARRYSCLFCRRKDKNTHEGLRYSLLRQLALHHDTYKLHVAERRCWMRLPFTARMLFLHEGHCTIASFGLLALRMVVKNSIGCVSTGGPAARAS